MLKAQLTFLGNNTSIWKILTARHPDGVDSLITPFLWQIKGSFVVHLPIFQPCVCRWTRVKILHGSQGQARCRAFQHTPSMKRLETKGHTHLSRVEHTTGFLSGLDWLVWAPVGEVEGSLVNPGEDSGVRTNADQTNPHIENLAIWRTQNIIIPFFFNPKAATLKSL